MNQYGLLNRIFGTKPLPKTMRICVQLAPQEQTEINDKSIANFWYEKCIWEFRTFVHSTVQGHVF